MVSTRQMSNVGGAGGSSDGAGPSNVDGNTSRITRHSGVLPNIPPPSSPPQNPHHWSLAFMPKVNSLPNQPNRAFSTGVLDLPPELLEKIFSYLKFKNVAHLRLVCRQLNNVCGAYLNSSFQRILSQMLHRYQNIKSKMPRRESARRNHPLACESDIIETLHMRLALLQMTFGKHIERKYCCFFPGEILDEVYSILEYLRVTSKLARPYKVTDELFDLSTMAMEYFKEHMEPNLPEITYFGTEFFDITGTFSPGDGNKSYLCLDSPPAVVSGGEGRSGNVSGGEGCSGGGGGGGGMPPLHAAERLPPSPPPPQSNMVLRKRIHRIKQGMKRYNNQLSALRSDLRSCKRKTAWQQKQIAEQQRQLAEQQKQTLEYAARLDENDKKNEETCRKFQTLLQELNKCRTELQYWRSKSPATTQALCAECGRPTSGFLPPSLPQNFLLQQDESMCEVAAAPTVLDDPGPSPATSFPLPGGSSPSPTPGAVPEFSPIENPMSPKALALVTSTSKTPGSPKARRPTQGDSKSLSSDEGPSSSKRLPEEPMSPHQDNKKRRLHRTAKPRKP